MSVSVKVTGWVDNTIEYSELLLAAAEQCGLGDSEPNQRERIVANRLRGGWLLNRRRKRLDNIPELIYALDQAVQRGEAGFGVPSTLTIAVDAGFDSNFLPGNVNPNALADSGNVSYKLSYRTHPHTGQAMTKAVQCTMATTVGEMHELALEHAGISIPNTTITKACLGATGTDCTRLALEDVGAAYTLHGDKMELTLTRKQLGALAAYGATIAGEVSGHPTLHVGINQEGNVVFTCMEPAKPGELHNTAGAMV